MTLYDMVPYALTICVLFSWYMFGAKTRKGPVVEALTFTPHWEDFLDILERAKKANYLLAKHCAHLANPDKPPCSSDELKFLGKGQDGKKLDGPSILRKIASGCVGWFTFISPIGNMFTDFTGGIAVKTPTWGLDDDINPISGREDGIEQTKTFVRRLFDFYKTEWKQVLTLMVSMALKASENAEDPGEKDDLLKVASLFTRMLGARSAEQLYQFGVIITVMCQTWANGANKEHWACFSVAWPHTQTTFHFGPNAGLYFPQDEIDAHRRCNERVVRRMRANGYGHKFLNLGEPLAPPGKGGGLAEVMHHGPSNWFLFKGLFGW